MKEFIQNAPVSVFVVMVAFPLAMTGLAVFAGLQARRRAALVKATPTSPIAFAADGYREFEGAADAVAGQTLTAPLTGAECVWYHAKVEQHVSGSGTRHASRWQTVNEITSSAPLLVRDATGACAVYPFGAEVTPTDRSVWLGPTAVPVDRNPERHLLTDLPAVTGEVAGGPNGRFRYTEERIYPGDSLLVLGHFNSGRFASSASDDDEEVVGEAGEGEGPATLAGDDEPADAWDDSEITDRLTALAQSSSRSSIGPGPGGQPFVVSATPQAQHLHLTEVGSSGALTIALVPLAIAALLLWTRFGG